MKLPNYKISIDPAYATDGEDLGISQIAFTANPAIKVKGMAFNASEKKQYFTDEPKMRIAAPALIPMEIYRNDEDGEYYVTFSVEEIEAIHSKFMANLSNVGKFNLEHNDAKTVPAYILETWIVNDPKKDKAFSTFGIEVPTGTLMVVAQITDKPYYQSLVANDQVGFSIEGFLGMKLADLQIAQELINSNKLNKMSKQISVLPDGTKFEIEGKKYVIVKGLVTEDTTPDTETPADAVTETDLAKVPAVKDAVAPVACAVETPIPVADPEKVKAEGATPEALAVPEVTPALDEAGILAIIQPKLDEIYKMIADLKAADVTEDDAEATVTKPIMMTIHDKYAVVMKLNRDK